jgi:DNA-binding MarR family transcriptional regulator
MKAAARTQHLEENLARELLDFFFPVHYQIEIALEDALRGGVLTRKQIAILWLIRSAGEDGQRMRRKDIERSLQAWFEITSSAVSKAIRGMARPPLTLVQITEDPRSGREKLVSLTPQGERFFATMVARGEAFIHRLVDQLPPNLVRSHIEFLGQAIQVFAQEQATTPGWNSSKR